MTAFKDKIQRAIESTSNDVQQWYQKSISEVAQAVHDHLIRDMTPDSLTEELKSQLEEAQSRIKTLEGQLEDANNTIADNEKEIETLKAELNPAGDSSDEDPDESEDDTKEDEVKEKSVAAKVKEAVTGKKKKKNK